MIVTGLERPLLGFESEYRLCTGPVRIGCANEGNGLLHERSVEWNGLIVLSLNVPKLF